MNNITYTVTKIEYFVQNATVLAYIYVNDWTKATCYLGGKEYQEVFNEREPYDFKTHVFQFPEIELSTYQEYVLYLTPYFENDKNIVEQKRIEFDKSLVVSSEIASSRSNRHISVVESFKTYLSYDAEYILEECVTENKLPIQHHILKISLDGCSIVTGISTNKCGTKNKGQTVLEQAMQLKGTYNRKVLAATNADFFDIMDSGLPSGLCVTNGYVINNPDTSRPFFAILKNGEPFIGTLKNIDVKNIQEAVGGMQILVADGKVFDTALIHPFGERAHPRTAIGICRDRSIIILVVDGRRENISNGASLIELSKTLIRHGAISALNLDGGGSATMLINKSEQMILVNHPTDLDNPDIDTIRPVYNSLVVINKRSM